MMEPTTHKRNVCFEAGISQILAWIEPLTGFGNLVRLV